MNANAKDLVAADPWGTMAPIPEQSEGPAILSMIERAARDPSVDIEKFERLMAMSERVQDRAARSAFAAAISDAKAEIEPAMRNATGHNDKKYADFASYARAADPILGKHGLSYRFRSSQADRITVTCILSHREGHSEETTLSGPPDKTGSKNDIQAIGSTLTYLQRYSLILSLGLASAADDDGRGASDGGDIGLDEVAYVNTLLRDTASDTAKFLQAIKAESIEAMTFAQYERALEMLNEKKRRMSRAPK